MKEATAAQFPKECFFSHPITGSASPMELVRPVDLRGHGRFLNTTFECGKESGFLLLGLGVSAAGVAELPGTVTLSVDGEKLVVDELLKDFSEPGKTRIKRPDGATCLFWAVDSEQNPIGPFLPTGSNILVTTDGAGEDLEIALVMAEYRLGSGQTLYGPPPETKYAVFRDPGHVLVGIEREGFTVITLGEEYGEGTYEVMKFYGTRHQATFRQVVDRRVGEAKHTKPVPGGKLPGPVKDQGILRNL